MDFKKIISIFFFVFLGLNIFLFSIYWDSIHQQNLISQTNRVEDLNQRLKNDDISYEGSFSTKTKEGYYLSGDQTDMGSALYNSRDDRLAELQSQGVVSDNQLIYSPTKDFTVKKKNIAKSLANFLDEPEMIMFGQEYQYLPELSDLAQDHPQIVAAQSYEGIPFNDETSRLTLNVTPTTAKNKEFMIKEYTQTHLDKIEALREKMSLYSEKEIINTLYLNNRFPKNSKILKTFLAYYRILEVREKNVYVPVWFVWVEGSDKTLQVEKVNALSNTIITNNLVPKVENR